MLKGRVLGLLRYMFWVGMVYTGFIIGLKVTWGIMGALGL